MEVPTDVATALREGIEHPGPVVVLTGAGISAESGVPTFRGEEGFWTVGSTNYAPMEMATSAMFSRHPRAVWSWYLYRLGVCRAAQPNPAHRALVRLEAALDDRFVLVTQNVDGLHRRAGSQHLLEVHGDIELMRCSRPCSLRLRPIPSGAEPVDRGQQVDDASLARLRCPDCGALARPHVLWFDEYYNEELFFWESAQRAASEASLLVVVGSSGVPNLPLRMAQLATAAGTTLIEVNPAESAFTPLLPRPEMLLRSPASIAVPQLVDTLIEL